MAIYEFIKYWSYLSKNINKTFQLFFLGEHTYESYRSWSPLTEEGYAEKLRLLREASTIPMERWRAPTVLAWLEVALGMPQYGARCAENIKSGKVSILFSTSNSRTDSISGSM